MSYFCVLSFCFSDPKKFKDIFPNKKGRKKLSYVVAHMPPANETTDVAPEIAAIRGIMNMIRTNRIHLLLGPTLNLDFDSMAMMPGVFNITQVCARAQTHTHTHSNLRCCWYFYCNPNSK